MTLVRRSNFKGLNLRSSAINRSDDYASDLQNVELNDRKEIVKRFGYSSIVEGSSSFLEEYKRGNELICIRQGGIQKLSNDETAWEEINRSTGSVIDLINNADFDEYNGVLYWTDPSGSNELYKYDGYTFYRAGVPAPKVTTSTGAGSFFYRVFLRFQDGQGNITSGNYVQFDDFADNASFVVEQMGEGFYQKYGEPSGPYTVSSVNVDIPMLAGHNYVANDWIILYNGDQWEPIRVASVDATTVTVDPTSFPQSGNTYDILPSVALETYRTEIVVAKSTDQTFGYETHSLRPSESMNKQAGDTTIDTSLLTFDTPLEDVYDTTLLKGLPPKCRYITFYNNVMVLANRVQSQPLLNQKVTDDRSTMFWSDTGVGSTVETFPPFNLDTVGKSSEGDINGIKALSDNIVVGKERQIYYVNGNLILQSYRIRSALTNGVGCISYRSMQEIEGGVLFMSSRGLYLARYGQKPLELSDLIEPLFRRAVGFNLSATVVKNDIKNEKLLIFIPALEDEDSVVLVYDYLYKEWFLHRQINAKNGLAFKGEDLYHSDNVNLYKRSTEYNDNESAIDAYYRTNFEHRGFPSIVKKWIKFVILSIGNVNWTLNLKTQHDWTDEDVTNQEIEINNTVRVQDKSLNMAQRKSMRIEMRNNKKNQGMLVTGYEYEYEFTQERPKGES